MNNSHLLSLPNPDGRTPHRWPRCFRGSAWRPIHCFCLWSCLLAGSPRAAHGITYSWDSLQLQDVFDFLVYDFGLAPGGRISGEIYNDEPANGTYFMIFSNQQWQVWRHHGTRFMPGSYRLYDSYLGSFWRQPLNDYMKVDFLVDAPAPTRYFIGIFNAHRHAIRVHGALSVTNPHGQELPLQLAGLPGVLLATGLLFLLGALAIALLLATVWRRGRTAIHFVMFVVVLLKAVALLLQCRDRVILSITGVDSGVSEAIWQLVGKVQDISELMMFLLIALGWKILRGTLNITEVRFAVGVSVISFFLGMFEVACTTNVTCSSYELTRYILRSLCYLVVIVAMNFNLQVVHTHIMDAPASQDVGKHYRKFRAYTIFRWVFLAFIVAPTVELFLVSTMPWDAIWAHVLIENLRTWAIYACVILAFRPGVPHLRVLELTVREEETDDEDVEPEVAL